MSSVDGLITGMDTTAVISQLMQLERQPMLRLQARRTQVQDVIAAYRSLNTKVDAIRAAAAELAAPTGWAAFTASSTSESVATATAGSSALPGSLEITVASVAKAHSIASSGAVSGTSTVVADGPLQITKGGVALDPIDVGDGTLASVVDAVNQAGVGVTATALQVADNQYKLVLTSTTTGAASTFTVDAGLNSALGTMTSTVTQGADAQITIGDLTSEPISSATNTFTGVLPGVTLTVKGAGTATISVARDGDALADKVQKLVDAANAALAEIGDATAYDSTTKKAGLLLGDSTVRRLQSAILNAVSDAVGGSRLGSAANAGLSLTRTGTLTFDSDAFLAEYAKDPNAVSALFEQGAVIDRAGLSFVGAADAMPAGTYSVDVTTLAERGTLTSTGVLTAGEQITVDVGGVSASYTVAGTDTVDSVAQQLNAALAAGGVAAATRVDTSGNLVVDTATYGSAATVSVTSTGGLFAAGTTADSGVDAAGTISYTDATGAPVAVTATGSGRTLTAPADDPVVGGLVVRATASGTFALTYTPGVAQRLVSTAKDAIDSVSGSLTLAIDGRESSVRSLDTAIESWESRLDVREAALRRQFAALETALGRLSSQSNWLASQIAGLPGGQ